jgi:hypothetical protein
MIENVGREEGQSSPMIFDPVFPWVLVLLLGVLLFGFSWWTYPAGTPGRSILLLLRAGSILVILWVLLRPSWLDRTGENSSTNLIFLLDQSRSMAIADEAGGRTRWASAIKEIEESQPIRDELANKLGTRWFTFGEELSERPMVETLEQEPTQSKTAIGDALEGVLRQSAGSPVAGVVLLSDGANTAGVSPVQMSRRFKSARIPIHVVGFGQEVVSSQSRDLIARSIRANPTVFAKNKLTVTGEFDVSTVGNTPVNVRLLFNGAGQSSGEFRAGERAQRLLTDLSATPTVPGDLKITLDATVPGDPQSNNNSISTYITVLSGGISVLAIEGKYRFWEPKYVRWALDQSPDISLDQFYLQEGSQKQSLPEEYLVPGRVDVFLLGDLAANRLPRAQLEAIRDRVESNGAGLMMMGGYESFGPGGWGESPLASVLPVVMTKGDAQRSNSTPIVPTAEGLRHFILRLSNDAQANQLAWQSLSPLDGSSSWSSLKPGAQLLAESPERVGLLAAQNVGAGRSVAFAGDTTWRWRQDSIKIGYHARFWRQLVLWLARKEETGSASLKVTLAARRVPLGQGLPLTVQALSKEGNPLPDAAIQVDVVSPSGTRSAVTLYPQDQQQLGTVRDLTELGDYTVEVSGKAGSEDLGKTSVKFLTYSEDAESQQTAADFGLLRSLAQGTGGEFVRHLELDKLLRRLVDRPLPERPATSELTPLWDRWEPLAVFLALLTIEWGLRKRWGLI